jgi:hypothetical protein
LPVAANSAQANASFGLTKREYFAAQMMAALVSTLVEDEEQPLDLEQQSKSFAIAAVAYADALITELNQPSLLSEVELEEPAPLQRLEEYGERSTKD